MMDFLIIDAGGRPAGIAFESRTMANDERDRLNENIRRAHPYITGSPYRVQQIEIVGVNE